MNGDDPAPDIPLGAEFVTLKQVADSIRIHPNTIRGWNRQGILGPEHGLRRTPGARAGWFTGKPSRRIFSSRT
jgi:hypothetical protein